MSRGRGRGRLAALRARGFTLLELLIAMSLTSIILVLLYSGFDIGIKSWDRGQARADRLNELRLAQDFLRRQLRQSVTVYRNDPRDGRVLYFYGEPDRVGWVAPMLRYLGLGGLYYVELDRVGDPDDGQLRLRWYPYNPNDEEIRIDDEELVEQTVLLDGVSDFSIDYLGPGETFEDEMEWSDRWENPQLRPTLVRLNLNLRDADWPPLTVAVLN